MHDTDGLRVRNDVPTRFSDLNAVLGELVVTVREILGATLIGAYLTGSFALGAGDEWSDVDFLVVTRGEVGEDQLGRLRVMHARFPALANPWAQHLEGSYAPADALRTVDSNRAPWWYVDNGSPQMERSNHDNTAHLRWALREYGVTLAGLDPRTLVEPVSADDLRAEGRAKLLEWDEYLRALNASGQTWDAWLQPHAILSVCRVLYTLAMARVTSKREAGEWALGTLDAQWAPLIQQAMNDRPHPWERARQSADPTRAEETTRFVSYTLTYAGISPA